MLQSTCRFVRGGRLPLLLVLLGTGGAVRAARDEVFAGESRKWRHYDSPHFELFSAARDFESRDLLHNLELLRALFLGNFKLKERQPLEVTVYYFSEKRDFYHYVEESMRHNDNLAGYYLSRPDRASIAISPLWDDSSERAVIFHEYIHHLVQVTGQDPPLWFNEGVAEIYSSVEIDGGSLAIGKPLPWHVAMLREQKLLPLEVVFAVDHNSPIYNTGNHTGLFYAESWALLHFFYFGRSGLDPGKIDLFMRYVLNEPPGADLAFRRRLFKEATGMDYAEMEDRLQRYVNGGDYYWRKVPLPDIPSAESYARREVPLREIRERLAELDLRVNQSPAGRLEMLQAADADPRDPRPLEVLGSDALGQGDETTARERWQGALAAGSRNPAVYRVLGQIEAVRWFSRFDYYFRLPDARAANLRQLLHNSIACAPDQSDAYETLAWVEACANTPDIGNVNLVQARFPTLYHKKHTLLALALVRLHVGDRATATTLLAQIDKMGPDPFVAAAVGIVRSLMEGRGGPSEVDPVVNASGPWVSPLVMPGPH